ncbi:MAG: GH92 family glycosyl hydrolase [Bacteroidales bacterium]
MITKYFKILLLIIPAIIVLSNCSGSHEPASYVNPFTGTDAHGHTYPGATVPFGMVQLSPQTRLTGWDGCSGYHYTDSVIYGFAHTALNGTGVGDYGDILVMPVVGAPVFDNNLYSSEFDKKSEYAQPAYYRVKLDKPGVVAEMTATPRVGYHRYTFPESELSNIIIDLQHRDRVTDSQIEIINNKEIRGVRRSSNWAKDMIWYFHMEFSKPFIRSGIAVNDTLIDGIKVARGKNIKAFIGFNTKKGEQIEVKVSLSAVDNEGAKLNMESELPGWGFDQTKEEGWKRWNRELSKIEVTGGGKEKKKVFYTALYHTMVQPNLFMDADNRYRGIDRNIHTATGFTNYTVFSLWDTYRAWHPLMTIIDTKRSLDFIKTMLNIYDKGGLLPIWELAGNETYCMIGNHSIPVIADAWMKGIRGFDPSIAIKAMVNSASKDHYGLDAYRKYQYIPGDKEHGSISKTLEYAYNDWCIAIMARETGDEELYKEYIRRAQSYKNIFCTTTGFMRPRMNGGWLTPFDPTTIDWHFTEANSWHYSFYVPQDLEGLIALHGSKEKFSDKIDELFSTDAKISGMDLKDVTGLIGQYAQGNEPSHHMAYLYNFAAEPWKTQMRVRQIMDDFFTSKPDGLSGNEDCGQMSAWLVMSAMGFYPVTPGNPEYIIGTPWFPKVKINLENGKSFTIEAKNLTKRGMYIKGATLNGEAYNKSFLSHKTIMEGGSIVFQMSGKPEKSWGTGEGETPVTSVRDELILPVPYVESSAPIIRDSTQVALKSTLPNVKIYYTVDGTLPDTTSLLYTAPFILKKSTTVTAIAFDKSLGISKPVEARFTRIELNRSVKLLTPYNKNYTGGGDDALIDGLRGSDNWRLGSWQGFQGTDFEAIVDLGSKKQLNSVYGSFVQDIRSWIWFPKSVTVYTSEDGINFREQSTVKNDTPTDDYEISLKEIGLKRKMVGRYVKFKAANFGKIPAWHLGSGGDAFIFIDEIIIE